MKERKKEKRKKKVFEQKYCVYHSLVFFFFFFFFFFVPSISVRFDCVICYVMIPIKHLDTMRSGFQIWEHISNNSDLVIKSNISN